jgi:hypothetical protein
VDDWSTRVWTASPQIAAAGAHGRKPPTVTVNRRPARREKYSALYL